MKAKIENYVNLNQNELFQLLKKLCSIPAPSRLEHERAKFCKQWLENVGAKDVYIDSNLNVVVPINCDKSNQITLFCAHTDTVFSDTEQMPYTEDEQYIYSPGICDNTANLAILLMSIKYCIQNNTFFPKGALFVCNSCEEGLGNLDGIKEIFKNYAGRISKFISFDSLYSEIATRCVGSHRYKVVVNTEGGHSYLAFGKKNANQVLASIINEIYKIVPPIKNNSKTTYNVGIIEGGTSVNTISQKASMLCEYRSDNAECLAIMQKTFEDIFENAREKGVNVSVEMVGIRPCMENVDLSKIEEMANICKNIIEDATNIKVHYISSSTDCNIPLSLGIPAVCVGVCDGGGRHTREEYLEKNSFNKGLFVGIKIILALTGEEF